MFICLTISFTYVRLKSFWPATTPSKFLYLTIPVDNITTIPPSMQTDHLHAHDIVVVSELYESFLTVNGNNNVNNPNSITSYTSHRLQCESKKSPPWNFLTCFPNGWEFLVQILRAYYMLLSTLDYKFLFNYLQFWWSYAILSANTITCSKCPPSTKMHAGWSHLIWHNFVTVQDKWIKNCILA